MQGILRRSAIEVVYFDLGRVIVHFDVDRMCRRMAAVTEVTPDEVRAVLFEQGLQRDYELGRIREDEFFELYCRGTGKRPPRDRLFQAANDIFWLNLANLPIVAQLQAAGFPLGILSNTCETHWRYCYEKYAILQGFRFHALSWRIGAMKPEPAVYRAAADIAATPPDRIFFVDDIAAHVEGARQAGFHAFHYAVDPAGKNQWEAARALADALRGFGIRFNY
ncbi:MAG: HAD family phosphatase [Thermogutta sp.]|nr:HAD family phosphatase [Thermogutta sp.]